jgi:hypothetical protein
VTSSAILVRRRTSLHLVILEDAFFPQLIVTRNERFMETLANRHDAESIVDVLLLLAVLLGRQPRTLRCAWTLIFTSMAAQQLNNIIPISTPLHEYKAPAERSCLGLRIHPD